MNLDIQAIVNAKLSEMAENKIIETQIQTSLEKLSARACTLR